MYCRYLLLLLSIVCIIHLLSIAFYSLQLGFNNIQSISAIAEYFNKLQLGFINFPKLLNKVMKNNTFTNTCS